MARTGLIWLRRVTASCKDFAEILDSQKLGEIGLLRYYYVFKQSSSLRSLLFTWLVGWFVGWLFSHVYSVNPFVTSGTYMSRWSRMG